MKLQHPKLSIAIGASLVTWSAQADHPTYWAPNFPQIVEAQEQGRTRTYTETETQTYTSVEDRKQVRPFKASRRHKPHTKQPRRW